MINSLLSILGSYTPIMTDVYDETGQLVGQVVASGAAGVDWSWVIGGLLFVVVIYSLFRLIGGLLK